MIKATPSRLLALILLLAFGLGGCSDSSSPDPEACTLEETNHYVYSLMKGPYYWYDEVPDTSYENFSTPWQLLDYLIGDIQKDKWSYLTTQKAYHNYMEEGRYIGIGIGQEIREQTRLFISFVYDDSPAARAGFERGDEILAINGTSAREIIEDDLMESVYGETKVGVAVEFRVRKKAGTTHGLPVNKDWVTINTVLESKIIQRAQRKVAYLAFKGFLVTAMDELDNALAAFRSESVDDLVLDLRYNGGGRGSVAKYLAGQIAGENVRDGIFTKFVHNRNFSHWNEAVAFEDEDVEGGLDLDRLYVITTDASCSASEMMINNLAPYIEVITVGATTCGKPVGMYARDFCTDMHINAIEFRYDNADDEGSFFDGLSPDCRADDDLTFALGDPLEDSLEKALTLIDGEACPLESAAFDEIGEPKKDLYQDGFRREMGAF